VAGDPRYKVLIVQKSDMLLHRGLLVDEKKKKKISNIQHRLGMNFKIVLKKKLKLFCKNCS
jgi:hypothetical protein